MKQMTNIQNSIAKSIVETFGGCYLDSNNISWKIINGEWIGKRSVWTYDYRACWLEDTEISNIKTWWCGKENDYKEIFKK